MRAMNAHDTPSGTRMMWNASVNAICDRAHGTGFDREQWRSSQHCGQPSRSMRCSPTRRALAMIVRVGFTAPIDGKKLESTT